MDANRWGRHPTIDKTLALLAKTRKPPVVIVEVGAIRNPAGRIGDGHATIAWASIAKELGGGSKVYSVDIDPKAVHLTYEMTKEFDNIATICEDGIKYLRHFKEPIDLLYLDGHDVGTTNYQGFHFEMFYQALPNLGKGSLVLVDDINFPDGGKGGLIRGYALENGWDEVFHEGQQMLLKRRRLG